MGEGGKRQPIPVAGFRNGELVGVKSISEWAAELGMTYKAVSFDKCNERKTKGGLLFRDATDEEIERAKS